MWEGASFIPNESKSAQLKAADDHMNLRWVASSKQTESLGGLVPWSTSRLLQEIQTGSDCLLNCYTHLELNIPDCLLQLSFFCNTKWFIGLRLNLKLSILFLPLHCSLNVPPCSFTHLMLWWCLLESKVLNLPLIHACSLSIQICFSTPSTLLVT